MTKPTRGREAVRKRPFAAFALAVLALTTLAGGASASHSTGGGSNSLDFAVGSGRYLEEYAEQHFRVEAQSGPSGQDPRGTYSASSPRDPETNEDDFYTRGEVICLKVTPNYQGDPNTTHALVGVKITEARNAQLNDTTEGNATLIQIWDVGPPGEQKDTGKPEFRSNERSEDRAAVMQQHQPQLTPDDLADCDIRDFTGGSRGAVFGQGNFTVHDATP